jgi:RluA family pseudouridine synthase
MIRLIDHLKARGLSPGDARRALASGKVFYGLLAVADPARLVDPDRVRVVPDAPRLRVGRDPQLVHVDEHLAIVCKPAGMLSVPAPGRRGERNLVAWAHRALGEAHRVHRLDEDTSGLILVARSERMRARLIDLISSHRIERGYLALVAGHVPDRTHTLRSHIARNRGDGLRGSSGDEAGGEAITHIVSSTPLKGVSLVELRLETGRTHQVRIHMAEFGHPVLGDWLYGGRGPGAPRLALHAWRLALDHPATGVRRECEIPLPDDLEAIRAALEPPVRRARPVEGRASGEEGARRVRPGARPKQ